MVALNEFIQIHDGAIESDICDSLIEIFEVNPSFQETEQGQHYSQFNLTDARELSEGINEIHNKLIRNVYKYRDEYYESYDKRVFPEKHSFEKFKIQRFLPNEEDAGEVVLDVHNHTKAKRFLCFMWYLSDNSAGQDQFVDTFIQPEKGKLVVYPSLWLFPHKKISPVNEPQYMLKTFLHYK